MKTARRNHYFGARLCFAAGLSVCVASLLAFSGCSKSKGPPPQGRRVVLVEVATATQKDVPIQVNAIGTVEAYSTVAVRSLVSGAITKVHFTEGQEVSKGSVLFSIDPRPFEAALKQAEAALAKDEALAKNAELEARRAEDLFRTNTLSQQGYDEARAKEAAAHAQVAASRALVENAKLQLEYCTIRSPIDGRTGSLMVNEGNVVKANDMPLVTINQLSPIFVSFSVPERRLSEIRRLTAERALVVQAFIPDQPDAPESGTLTFINNTVDKTTGMILLKATFANQTHRLWPGQFVNVVLTLSEQRGAVVVPAAAVQTGQQQQYVFVVKPDQTVEFRRVTAGITYGGETVIENGLVPGETVVTDGQLQLQSGAKVQIKGAERPTTARP